jgi:3-phenylpropionate/trans-cinnamate dioxygenase ferredoxin subunit
MEHDSWIEVCAVGELEREDVIRFDLGEQSFAVYRTADDRYYATDGHCTHQKVHLADGLVTGNLIECPKHNGKFDITTGEAKRPPACLKLATYAVKVSDGFVMLKFQ